MLVNKDWMISSKILLTAGFDGLSKAKQVSPVSNWKANKSCLFENHTLWGEGGGWGNQYQAQGFSSSWWRFWGRAWYWVGFCRLQTKNNTHWEQYLTFVIVVACFAFICKSIRFSPCLSYSEYLVRLGSGWSNCIISLGFSLNSLGLTDPLSPPQEIPIPTV